MRTDILSRAALTACLTLALAACKDSQSSVATVPPPAEVGVIVATQRAMAVVRDLPGRVAPTRVAEVRPRVGGLIVKRRFEQGSQVHDGDALYEIDPNSYRAELESAKAEVARAEAVLVLARQQADRLRALAERQIMSRAQYETAYAALKQAEAGLAGARASQTRAELNLSYTTVRAPISGRIGRALATEGALIDQNSTTALAVIQQLNPIYVDITQSVGELRKLRRDLANGSLSRIAPDVATVRLVLEDGEVYGEAGRLLFSEMTADQSTGQVTLRVEIPNPASELFPGMYVRARIEQAIDADAIAVPQQAVQRDGDGHAQLFVVGEDQTVSARSVVLGNVVDGQWVIEEGLKAGERVVVDGFQRVTPGSRVAVQVLDARRLTQAAAPSRTAQAR